MARSKSLTALPSELLFKVTRNLDILSRTCLRLTNQHLNILIPTPGRSALIQMQSLLYDRKGPSHFFCKTCARLRSRRQFSDDQVMAKPHLKNDLCHRHALPCNHSWRFCIDCGISGSQPAYSTGSMIWMKGVRHVVCRSCRNVGRAVDSGSGVFGGEVCRECSWSQAVGGVARLAR